MIKLTVLVALTVLIPLLNASPHLHTCQCPNGQLGMQCPNPIQLNCPQQQCPPPPPCPMNAFPTIAPMMGFSNPNSIQGASLFTFPTIAPLGGGFNPSGQATTPLPLPVVPPTNGQESLLPIQNQQQQGGYVQQPQQPQVTVHMPNQGAQYQNQQFPQGGQQGAQYQQQLGQYQNVPPPPPPNPVQYQAPPPPPPLLNPVASQNEVNPTSKLAELPPAVDSTTKATTLPSELYVDADSPEIGQDPSQPIVPNGNKYSVYENEPNNNFRQPVRRALASNTKPEVISDKCNDERLKKIIEQNVDSNASSSKRKIQKAATEEIGGLFDVVCSSHDFSYLANTQLFCEAGNDDVTCFAFLHSLIQ